MKLNVFFRLNILVLFLLGTISDGVAQNTIGVLYYDASQAYDGYNLLFPSGDTNTYLIDNCGRVVHSWQNENVPGQVAFLLEDGNLLRSYSKGLSANPIFVQGGAADGIQLIDWNGNVLWDYKCSDSLKRMHHDLTYMPNGHILMHAWELKNKVEAIALGYDSTQLPANKKIWLEGIYEIVPVGYDSGTIVWEWHIEDHIIQDFNPTKLTYGVVADHPELIDINFNTEDPNDLFHINAIDYNPYLDQIIVGVPRVFSEVWIIDHSTTTAEAASHSGGKCGKGGDLLYRWGNPAAYNQGSLNDQKLFSHHATQWIDDSLMDAGKIMVFNNGNKRPGGVYSSVDIIVPPLDSSTYLYQYTAGTAYGPAAAEWIYTATPKESMFSDHISGAQRLENGNTFICDGANGNIFEINVNSEVVWRYEVPLDNSNPLTQGQQPVFDSSATDYTNTVFRCYRYGTNYAGLQGEILTPGNYIELNPDTTLCSDTATGINKIVGQKSSISVFPNPASEKAIFALSTDVELEDVSLALYDIYGKIVMIEKNISSHNVRIDCSALTGGMYLCSLQTKQGIIMNGKFIIE